MPPAATAWASDIGQFSKQGILEDVRLAFGCINEVRVSELYLGTFALLPEFLKGTVSFKQGLSKSNWKY